MTTPEKVKDIVTGRVFKVFRFYDWRLAVQVVDEEGTRWLNAGEYTAIHPLEGPSLDEYGNYGENNPPLKW